MFKIFKKKDKPQLVEKVEQKTPTDDMKIEKQLHKTRCMLQTIDDRMEQIDSKINHLNFTIRSLIKSNNRLQARAKIAELKSYQKQLQNLQTKRNVLTQFEIQIENFEQDMGVAETVFEATSLAKNQTKMNDQLSEAMLDYNQFQLDQQTTQQLIDQMAQVGVDQEDIEETFKIYEQELAAQNNQAIQQNIINVPTKQQYQQPMQQKQKQQQFQSPYDKKIQAQLDTLLE